LKNALAACPASFSALMGGCSKKVYIHSTATGLPPLQHSAV